MKVIDTDNLNHVSRERKREEILRHASSDPFLAKNFEDLVGDGGQPDETADEMIRAIREWRDFTTRSESRIVALVLDTDVVSYLYKNDTRAELYRPHLNDPPFIISFMTLAELRRWSLERGWAEFRKQSLEQYVSRYFVVHSDDELCSLWAYAINRARPEWSADRRL